MPKFAVIIPAAGASMRFAGGRQSKLIAELAGLPVITRAVLAFVQHPQAHQILIACPNEPHALPAAGARAAAEMPLSSRVNELWDALGRDAQVKNRLAGQIALVPGGTSRADSVRSALKRVPPEVEWVAVHDAARPLVSQELIERTFAAAIEHGAAAPAMPVALTIKRATGPLPAPVAQTVPRGELWAMQTPQILRRQWLMEAYDACPLPLDQVTDDLQLLELSGRTPWLVPGEEENLKITTPADLLLAEFFLRRRRA